MAELTDPETRTRIGVLEDIEAIRKLKARYFRCLDKKMWDELTACFTEDAVLAEHERNINLQGAKPIIEFLRQGLGPDHLITVHQGHNSEIEITSDTTARGTWALYSSLFNSQVNKGSRGWGVYEDEYAKEKGEWKIESTTISRLFTEKIRREG